MASPGAACAPHAAADNIRWVRPVAIARPREWVVYSTGETWGHRAGEAGLHLPDEAARGCNFPNEVGAGNGIQLVRICLIGQCLTQNVSWLLHQGVLFGTP